MFVAVQLIGCCGSHMRQWQNLRNGMSVTLRGRKVPPRNDPPKRSIVAANVVVTVATDAASLPAYYCLLWTPQEISPLHLAATSRSLASASGAENPTRARPWCVTWSRRPAPRLAASAQARPPAAPAPPPLASPSSPERRPRRRWRPTTSGRYRTFEERRRRRLGWPGDKGPNRNCWTQSHTLEPGVAYQASSSVPLGSVLESQAPRSSAALRLDVCFADRRVLLIQVPAARRVPSKACWLLLVPAYTTTCIR